MNGPRANPRRWVTGLVIAATLSLSGLGGHPIAGAETLPPLPPDLPSSACSVSVSSRDVGPGDTITVTSTSKLDVASALAGTAIPVPDFKMINRWAPPPELAGIPNLPHQVSIPRLGADAAITAIATSPVLNPVGPGQRVNPGGDNQSSDPRGWNFFPPEIVGRGPLWGPGSSVSVTTTIYAVPASITQPIVVGAIGSIRNIIFDPIGGTGPHCGAFFRLHPQPRRQQTTLSIISPETLPSTNTTIQAVLKDSSGTHIAGRQVTFKLGSQTCGPVTTDANGTATCTILALTQPLGPGTLTASFPGDSSFLASSDTKPILVFAYLDRGSFVIGDLNVRVGASVTFWGAQWAAANSLSRGGAPPSFKGFASEPSSQPPICGSAWMASPANSDNPPASVSAYMAVIAASSLTKSGRDITGDTRQIVVVKTDPGYEANPGHAGAGTVAASPSNAAAVAAVCG